MNGPENQGVSTVTNNSNLTTKTTTASNVIFVPLVPEEELEATGELIHNLLKVPKEELSKD